MWTQTRILPVTGSSHLQSNTGSLVLLILIFRWFNSSCDEALVSPLYSSVEIVLKWIQRISYDCSTHQVHNNKTQYDILTLTSICHKNNVVFFNPERDLDYSSTDLVRLALIIFASLCPLRPARKVWGLGTWLSPSLLLWQVAFLDSQVWVTFSRLMWLRSVCTECVTLVQRSVYSDKKQKHVYCIKLARLYVRNKQIAIYTVTKFNSRCAVREVDIFFTQNYIVNIIPHWNASNELWLTRLIAFLRSPHSFHSYDLTIFVSTGWRSVCVPLSHLLIGFTSKISPGWICKTQGSSWVWIKLPVKYEVPGVWKCVQSCQPQHHCQYYHHM